MVARLLDVRELAEIEVLKWRCLKLRLNPLPGLRSESSC
jgi:hypothetical protein